MHQKSQSSIPNPQSRIFIAGHRGMMGSAIVRRLKTDGFQNIITRTRQELDLTDQRVVRTFFATEKIDYVVLAAAKVGGIHANNTYPAEFIYNNLIIQTNIIHEAWHTGIKKLLFLGSSCIYPRECPQPIKEEYLLSGELEKTNEPYAVAKIAGIKMCEAYNRQYGTDYRAVMPTNLYGPNDNYDLENSHVLPALIRKFHLAKLAAQGDTETIKEDEAIHGPIPSDFKESLGLIDDCKLKTANSKLKVVLWGTGAPYREFLHVDDMADACIHVMGIDDSIYAAHTLPGCSFVNVGKGSDITIRELARLITEIVGYDGEVVWDDSKPDGTPKKLLDVSRIKKLGWQASINLQQGIESTYKTYSSKVGS